MNNQLTLQELAGYLAEHTGKDRVTAELFLREFISLIQESLLKGEKVEINQLGSFSIEQEQDETGELVVKRFIFSPDEYFRKMVNKPFSFFDKIEITDFDSVKNLEVESESVAENYDSIQEFQSEIQSEEKKEEIAETVVEEENQKEKAETNESEIEEDELGVATENSSAEQEQTSNEVESSSVISEPEQKADDEVNEQGKGVLPKEKEKKDQFVKVPSKSHVSRKRRRKSKKNYLVKVLAAVVVVAVVFLLSYIPQFTQNRRMARLNEIIEHANKDILSEKKDTLDIPASDSIVKKDTSLPVQKNKEKIVQKTDKKEKIKPQKRQVMDSIKIKSGDLLTEIALSYYGNKLFWVYIYLFNKETISNPNNVPIGTQLRIPSPEVYGIDCKNVQSRKKAAKLQTRILNGETIKLSDF